MADVLLRNVVKRFDEVEAVRSIDLDIRSSELVVLVGPSGCGKSTTLRMIAGLEEITSGEIFIGGELVNDLPPKDRDIAMVFQNYALYPHMTAFENMAFGLRLRKFSKSEIRARVEHAARILDITDLLSRRPKQLSGGQRQRVAMGRAIVRHPKVFLFDEPLSNLDAKLRVVVMNRGQVEQIGAPQELYHHPRTRFVAGFIGSPAMNFLPCRLEQNGVGMRVRVADSVALPVPEASAARYRGAIDRDMLFGLRPEHITEPRRNGGSQTREGREFSATLDVVEPMGMETLVYFNVGGTQVCGRVSPENARAPGEAMLLDANVDHMHLIDPETDLVL